MEGQIVMKICHVCNAQCDDTAELCPVCGADLIAVNDEATEEKVIENPVLLATLDDFVSAEILRDILNENGIPNSGSSNDEEGIVKVTFGGAFVAEEVFVDSSDFEKAEELYKEFLASEEFVFEDEEDAEF